MTSHRQRERLISVFSPIAVLLLWELAARLAWIDTRFFPAPSAILVEFLALLRTGELWGHLGVSLVRIVAGFLLGAVPGVLIGLAMGLSPLMRAIFQPLVSATFPIPKVAILPLFILMFGVGELSKYAVIAVSVVYLVIINTHEGVKNINPIYMDVGRNFGASRRMMFLDVAIPGALPNILAGMRLAAGVALLVIVAAEFVGAKSGIGYLIWNSWQIFAIERMYVGLMITALLGFASAAIFDAAEHVLIPWRRPVHGTR